MTTSADIMARNFRTRVASLKGDRGDLYFSEARHGRTAGVVEVLLGFTPELGIPKSAEVAEFVKREFGERLAFSPSSFRAFPEQGGVVLEVAKRVASVALKQANDLGLIPVVAGRSYVGSAGDAWDVVESSNGPVLIRKEADDVDAIIKERLQREHVQAGVRFAQIARLAGRMNLHPGDVVRFFADDKFMKGEVSSVNADGGATVKAEGGGSFSLSRQQIADVYEYGPGTLTEYEGENAEYFGKYFPSEGGGLAKDMAPTQPPAKKVLFNNPSSTMEVPKEVPLGAQVRTASAGGAGSQGTPAAALPQDDRELLSSAMRTAHVSAETVSSGSKLQRAHAQMMDAVAKNDWRLVAACAQNLDNLSREAGGRVKILLTGAVVER